MGRDSVVADCVGPTYSPHQAKEKGSPGDDTKEDRETPTAPGETYPRMDSGGGRTTGRRAIQTATRTGVKSKTGGERKRKIGEEDHPHIGASQRRAGGA